MLATMCPWPNLLEEAWLPTATESDCWSRMSKNKEVSMFQTESLLDC